MTDIDFNALAQQIATELGKLRGETWTCGDGWHNTQRRLSGPDGAELFVNSDSWRTRGKGRLTASGNFPKTKASLRTSEDISVDITRGAVTIAKEINRRLMPLYLARLAEVVTYNETERSQYEQRGVVMAKVAGVFGRTYEQAPYEEGSTAYREVFSLHGVGASGSVEASGRPDTLELALRSVPTETALRILSILAEPVKAQKGAQA